MSASDDYAGSRALALALYTDFPSLDGLAYRSRFNNGEVCFAIFDRVLPSDLAAMPGKRFDADPKRVDKLMTLHGAVFDTSSAVSHSAVDCTEAAAPFMQLFEKFIAHRKKMRATVKT